ncbi:choline ABC transporter substrate-binding protein [Bartonella sp. HY329]|uniref:choline ABC transporter substrate-binding protein n=1 Tax=unclassified Bartonella TaxID=2645622 RepID=UPI0021C9B50F|nr:MULTISPECIES: choline ABC transporter substrate-binding protein [unclassified Bartonella]UXM94510.1 choline ABC transporter substrate-binding protein [Bartonella sp. HY329]UXN08834.1 choline ABC transporter substrate-binding protein [Bartonella sp. HY328]
MNLLKLFGVALTCCLMTPSLTSLSLAEEPEACKTVRFAEPGWTDISATTAITTNILEKLGYKTKTTFLSVPITYAALSRGDIDVFLGYWSPSMIANLKPYADDGSVETVRVNLTGAKYTLAVPQFAYDAGLKSFDDIAKFGKDVNFTIYGIEPGNDGNSIIISMLKNHAYGLDNFKILESSEQAMLAKVQGDIAKKKPIIFLAWEPHPMNTRFDIAYLNGGDEYFGPDFGGATVSTNVRKNYVSECPNVGKFLTNLEFSLDMENKIMEDILEKRMKPEVAAANWLKNNPDIVDKWLDGVTTFDGKESLDLVRDAITK